MTELEREITMALRDEADRVFVPTPDPAALVARGRGLAAHAHRRLVWYGVACVAVVAIVFVGTSVLALNSLSRSADPSPAATSHGVDGHTRPVPTAVLRLSDLPRGAPPRLPYRLGSRFYVDGRPIPVAARTRVGMSEMASAVGRTVLATSSGVYLVVGKGVIRMTAQPGSFPVVSSDGRWAAWEVGGADISLVAWNLQTRAEIGRIVTPLQHATCCGGGDVAYPTGMDTLGRVYLSSGGPTWMWDHRTGAFSTIRAQPHDGSMTGVSGLSVFFHVDAPFEAVKAGGLPGEGHTVYGIVSASSRFQQRGRIPGQVTGWDPTGRRVLTTDLNGNHARVIDLTDHRAIQLHLPIRVNVVQPVWEGGSDVLVLVNIDRPPAGHGRAILRCSANNGECQTAAGPAGPAALDFPHG